MTMAAPGETVDAPASTKPAKDGQATPLLVPSTEPSIETLGDTEPSNPPEPRKITISPPSSRQSPKLSPVFKIVSPRTSRDPSPTRLAHPHAPQNPRPRTRSRKNSEDQSPQRSPAPSQTRDVPPSAAAVQRALSATGIPRLTPDPPSDTARSRAARTTTSSNAATTAANSSRVKSPPRSAPASRNSSAARRVENPQPLSQSLDEVATKLVEPGEGAEESENSESGIRSPTRASFGGHTLEAVQESSLPETPAIGAVSSPPPEPSRAAIPIPNPILTDPEEVTTKAINAILSTESESESSSSKKLSPVDGHDNASNQSLAQAVSRNATLQPKKSLSQMSTASSKGKGGGDGSVRNMTVETVDTKSLPHLAVNAATTDRGGNRTDGSGTLRVKPSNETIRPKKEKKKATRKSAQGTGAASSKADIFEAKVASAVDEADSSDSGETFVYESNPPEPPSRAGGPRFHHSRTPSAQSMASGLDPHGRVRPDGHNSVVGKKSMKFTNSLHNLADYQPDSDAIVGPSAAVANGTHRNGAHHIGRHGRTIGPVSVLGGDTPLVATPTRMRTNNQRHGSRGNTPREGRFARTPTKSQKYSAYELDDDDDNDGADDEETPLIHSAHSQRSYYTRNNRRTSARYRPANRGGKTSGFVRGACGWVLLGALVAVLVGAVVTALVLCSKPLHDVRIGEITNVIASEEEVVFDLRMFATNANLVTIQVDHLDMKIFARSKYVGSTAKAKYYAGERDVSTAPNKDDSFLAFTNRKAPLSTLDNIDEGTDPIDEPGGTDTMMLGRVYKLDSPLSFSPSPFSHARVSDVGEISLEKPGNRSADDGTERWKTVVQHPFDLIIVGQLKYALPISAKIHSVSVGRGRVHVIPNAPEEPPSLPPDNGGGNRTNSTRPGFMPGPVRVTVPTVSRPFAA